MKFVKENDLIYNKLTQVVTYLYKTTINWDEGCEFLARGSSILRSY